MEDRPERGVGKATVILIVILLGQAESDLSIVANGLAIGLRRAAYVAAPTEPYTAGLTQCIMNTNSKPARSDLPRLDRRYSVGNHY
jgi:hypothetical protein